MHITYVFLFIDATVQHKNFGTVSSGNLLAALRRRAKHNPGIYTPHLDPPRTGAELSFVQLELAMNMHIAVHPKLDGPSPEVRKST